MATFLNRLVSFFSGPELPPAGEMLLLDVRTPGEYQRGHISGALSLPLDQIDNLAHSVIPDNNLALVVYCQSGMRSAMARKILLKRGYPQVVNGGGIGKLTRRLASRNA